MVRLWFAFCVGAALSLGGCSLPAQLNGASVWGDAHGGIVSRVTTMNWDSAMYMANGWCGQYHLVATETQMSDSGMLFACVSSST